PESKSETIHAEARTSALTRKPDGAWTPQADSCTSGRGAGDCCHGATTSEVVTGSGGSSACGQLSVLGATSRVEDAGASSEVSPPSGLSESSNSPSKTSAMPCSGPTPCSAFMPCSVGSNSCAPTTGVDKAKVAPVNVVATKADSRRRWRPVLLRPPAGVEKVRLGEAFMV